MPTVEYERSAKDIEDVAKQARVLRLAAHPNVARVLYLATASPQPNEALTLSVYCRGYVVGMLLIDEIVTYALSLNPGLRSVDCARFISISNRVWGHTTKLWLYASFPTEGITRKTPIILEPLLWRPQHGVYL